MTRSKLSSTIVEEEINSGDISGAITRLRCHDNHAANGTFLLILPLPPTPPPPTPPPIRPAYSAECTSNAAKYNIHSRLTATNMPLAVIVLAGENKTAHTSVATRSIATAKRNVKKKRERERKKKSCLNFVVCRKLFHE